MRLPDANVVKFGVVDRQNYSWVMLPNEARAAALLHGLRVPGSVNSASCRKRACNTLTECRSGTCSQQQRQQALVSFEVRKKPRQRMTTS